MPKSTVAKAARLFAHQFKESNITGKKERIMGTRGLDGVVIDGEIKASYNQYDTYPSGLGLRMLGYGGVIARLDSEQLEELRNAWRAVVLVNEAVTPTEDQINTLRERGIKGDSNVSTGSDWYSWLRRNQGNPDAHVAAGYMLDSKTFGNGSLFCEWAWIIDLDELTLECYHGFQKDPHSGGRWSSAPVGNGYYGVKLLRTYALSDLPDDDDFEAEINKLAGYEEDQEEESPHA